MRKHLFYLSMVLVLTLFSACGGGKKGVFTPTSSGRAYEVLVVVEPGLWERPAGRALFDVLGTVWLWRIRFPSSSVPIKSGQSLR